MSTTTTLKVDKPVENYEDEHGTTFKILFYFAVFTTVFLLSYLKPPRIYKKAVSRFLNITFRWRGAYWKVYNILVIVIIIIGLFLFCKKIKLNLVLSSQVSQFTEDKPSMETHEKKLFRLKHKWLTEAEIWLTALIIFELV